MPSPLEDPAFTALYTVTGPLGRGGMGEVMRIQHRVWEVDLAAKIPLPAMIESAGGLAALRREAETWIRLPSHPHVVTCHYVRVFGDTPVIFIEYVDGGSLADAIRRGPFAGGAGTAAAQASALGIALDVARGLAHAHEAGVVHQDIKPSNVMLDRHGAKITDFGIASVGRQEIARAPARASRGAGTMLATVVGMTPLYASPEQLAALGWAGRDVRAPTSITRASDVWSLGLLLLETLLGEAPWRPGEIDPALRARAAPAGDVAELLGQMLAVAPGDRPSAAQVAATLEALLARRGVARAAPSAAELRADGLNNRAVSLLDLDSRDEARRLLAEALAIDPCHPEAVFNATLLAWRAGEVVDLGALDRVKQTLSAAEGWEARLLEAWIQIERGDEKGAWQVLDRVAEQAAGEPRATRAVARASRAVRDGVREIKSFRAHRGTADALAISRDERFVVTGGRDGAIGVFQLASGRRAHTLPGHQGFAFGVAPTRDLKRVYSVGWDEEVRGFEVASQRQLFHAPQPGKLRGALLSPDERRLWTSSFSGTLREWSLEGDEAVMVRDLLALEHDMSVMCLALTPDQQTLLVGGEDDSLHAFDVATGELRRSQTLASRPYALAFSEDGARSLLLIGSNDQQIAIHDLATWERLGALQGMRSAVSVLAVSPDHRWLVCNNGLHFSLWDLGERRCVRTFEAPDLVTEAAFLSNGELVTLDWSGTVRRYAIEAPGRAPMQVALPRRAREVAEGRAAVDASLAEARAALEAGRVPEALAAARAARARKGFERAPDVLAVWERIGLQARRAGIRAVWPLESWGPVKATYGLAVDPQRRFVVTADPAGKVSLWSLGAGEAHERLREISFASGDLSSRALALSSDGKLLAIGTYKHLYLIDLEGGSTRVSEVPQDYVRSVAFGEPGSDRIGILEGQGQAHLLRLSDLTRLATVRGPENWVNDLAFVGPDRLVVGDYDGHLLLWDMARAAASGFAPGERSAATPPRAEPPEALVRDLGAHAVAGRRSVHAIEVRDGRLVYACSDQKLHFLDPDSGEPLAALAGHDKPVSCFDFLDAERVLTGSFDNTVRVFDVRSGQTLARVEGHTHAIWGVAALDMHHFLTVSDDDQLRRFYIDWALEPA